MRKIDVAIIGSGNIGTDLMTKLLNRSAQLNLAAVVGIDPQSEGLRRAYEKGIPITAEGLAGFQSMATFDGVEIVFDASSAQAHVSTSEALRSTGKQLIDLTPAALGPFAVPVVNLDQHFDAPDINMTTCGGQATVPIVAAISRVASVQYAEIVASISSRSAGPGTRANIDEFTTTTARALETVGGATLGKAIIILNPAEPPMVMRNTVFVLSEEANRLEIEQSIHEMIAAVRAYVPGYRLKQRVQFEQFQSRRPSRFAEDGMSGLKTSVWLEVEGAGDYLPSYAGNLDIMTSAALAAGERLAMHRQRYWHER